MGNPFFKKSGIWKKAAKVRSKQNIDNDIQSTKNILPFNGTGFRLRENAFLVYFYFCCIVKKKKKNNSSFDSKSCEHFQGTSKFVKKISFF